MKKIILSVAILGLVLSACKKEDPATTSGSSLTGEATISGTVRAQTDQQTAEFEKKSGAVILARYNQADLVLNPVAGVTYPDKVISTKTDENGKYSFKIPTGGLPVNVEIIPQDFEQDVITGPASVLPDQLFSSGSSYTAISEKESQIIDLQY
jgi:hypothetical protein